MYHLVSTSKNLINKKKIVWLLTDAISFRLFGREIF